jgi:hypothetical protein
MPNTLKEFGWFVVTQRVLTYSLLSAISIKLTKLNKIPLGSCLTQT